MDSFDRAAVVDRWWNEVWDGDLDVIDEIVAEPFVRHGATGTTQQTRAELKRDMAQYLRVHHRPAVTIQDRSVDGDRVWTRLSTTGVDIDTGDATSFIWIQIHRVDEHGRLAEAWTLYARETSWT